MKKTVCLLIFGLVSCSLSPKKLDELNSENNYYSPAQTIKCMQMQTPQRPHPVNKKELFVAAKIAIFDESFVKNTINVGTPPAGNPNAQIAIAGGTVEPYISVGQTGVQGYGQPGAFIGVSNSNYDQGFGPNSTSGILSLTGTPVGGKYNQLAWDGSTLTIKGAIRQTAEGIVSRPE